MKLPEAAVLNRITIKKTILYEKVAKAAAEAKAEGAYTEKLKIAAIMKSSGIPVIDIIKYTGLSSQEILNA